MKNLSDYYNSAPLALGKMRVAVAPTKLLMDSTEIPTIEINRFVENRLNKMKKIFSNPTNTQHIVSVICLDDDCNIETPTENIEVSAGMKLADGNTRRLHWSANPQDMPDKVIIIFIDVENGDEYKREYYSIDSSDAVENSGNKIQGAVRLLGMDLRSRKGRNGAFGEALNYAYPRDPKDEKLVKVAYYKNELETIDKLGLFDPASSEISHAGAALISAFLIAQKLYKEPIEQVAKLHQGMKKLSMLEIETYQTFNHRDCTKDENDGMVSIMQEAAFRKQLGESFGSTKRADMPRAISLYLYCIEKWMSGKFMDKKRGFKKWDSTYAESMETLKEE